MEAWAFPTLSTSLNPLGMPSDTSVILAAGGAAVNPGRQVSTGQGDRGVPLPPPPPPPLGIEHKAFDLVRDSRGTNPRFLGGATHATPAADEVRYLDLDELDLVIAHAPAGPFRELDRALWRTAAMTGLRRGELLALRWGTSTGSPRASACAATTFAAPSARPRVAASTRSVPMAREVAVALEALSATTERSPTRSSSATRRPASRCTPRAPAAGSRAR